MILKTENDEMNLFVIQTALLWAKGVIFQGERLLSKNRELNMIQSIFIEKKGNGSQDMLNLISKNIDELRFEEYFFVVSIGRSRSYFEECLSIDSSFQKIIGILDAEIPRIKEVRNMREHDLSYFRGDGRKQKDFIFESEDGQYISDATGTIISDNNYLLGGRLSVNKSVELYGVLINEVEDIYNRFMSECYAT